MSALPGRPAAIASPSPEDASDRQRLEAVLDRTRGCKGRPRHFRPLPGGLTNRIYEIDLPSQRRIVGRVLAPSAGLLSVDREAERRNARIAARAGVGPRVIASDPAAGVALVECIHGRALEPADLDDSGQLARVAAACRRLHAGARFGNDFDMFAIQRGYLAIVRERGLRLPERYLEFEPHVEAIKAALATRPQGTLPCHNDLLAANIMDDGERIWLIDYEYAGNNDPCFELGNIWSEANLGPERLEELVTAYYGYRSPAKVARARLLAVMSKYGWALWASIQDAVSEVDFDFWSWGLEKYDRAVAEFDSPELPRLIRDAQLVDQPRGSTQ